MIPAMLVSMRVRRWSKVGPSGCAREEPGAASSTLKQEDEGQEMSSSAGYVRDSLRRQTHEVVLGSGYVMRKVKRWSRRISR
jgi:hypothetical protein